MTKFKCSGCDYESLRKESVKRHIGNKKKCCDQELSIVEMKYEIVCEHCSHKFSTEVSKYNHQKKCKSKTVVEELQEKVESLEALLSKYLKEGEKKIKRSTIPKLDYKPFDNPDDVLCQYGENKQVIPTSKTQVKQLHNLKSIPLNCRLVEPNYWNLSLTLWPIGNLLVLLHHFKPHRSQQLLMTIQSVLPLIGEWNLGIE